MICIMWLFCILELNFGDFINFAYLSFSFSVIV